MAGRRNGERQRVRLTLRRWGADGQRIYHIDALARDVPAVLAAEGADLLRVDRLRRRGRATT